MNSKNIYTEAQKDIPIRGSFDVVVCGGGPAGIGAAVSAARTGAKTLLIESSGTLGGVSTSGLMSHWTGDSKGPLYEEVLQRSYTAGPDYYFDDNRGYEYKNKFIINTEKLKSTYIEMIEESTIELLLYTQVSLPIMNKNTIKGVIIESKSGREAIFAKTVIDATGDGDIAYKSGVPYLKGRHKDKRMQPMTLMFKVGGVDYSKACFALFFEDNYTMSNGYRIQDIAKKELAQPMGHVLLYPNQIHGVVSVNMSNCINVDGTKIEDLTYATLLCQKQIPLIISFLQKYIPGYEQCYLYQTASHIGVRETRHFKGLETITAQDISEGKQFDDWIATECFFNFDIHNLDGSGLDPMGEQDNFSQIERYTIPYSCIVPENIDGLLLAGRNISGTHIAHSNYRVMPICINIGQGAGVAAALSAKNGITLRNLNVKEIQEILITQGVRLPQKQ